jgi:hypothetical protein
MKNIFISLLFLSLGNVLCAQTLEVKTYSKLVKADKDDFISFAKSSGFETDFDETSQTLFAATKGCIYAKPIGEKNNNEYFDLVLIVSTLDKENNKLILKNAIENTEKKGTWTDDKYLYKEWDMENPNTKEVWYKVLVYKKKK